MRTLIDSRQRNWIFAFMPALCLATLMSLQCAQAQDGGEDDDEDNLVAAGVAVDADGVLQRLTASDPDGSLARERIQQALASLDADVAQRSELRKVSLTRLAKLIKNSIDEGHGPDEAMKHLAGLTRIKYAFYYPETQDIVIAGPAEGWMQDLAGRSVGIESGRPVLELQDLIVALRTFAPNKNSKPVVYCSIDASEEGLARMQQFLSQLGSSIQPNDEQFIVEGLRESLGLQVVTIGGVPANTHFAQILVEADYRMKLIGIGLEEPAANIRSWISLANFASVARNAMARWWFVPDYQRIRVSEDGLAAEFVGNGVKLMGEDEVVSTDGSRRSVGSQNRASQRFTQGFTEKYGQLADRDPVYAQLRNCIDMLVVAALLQKNDFYGQANWDLSVLGDEQAYPVETYNAPKHVNPMVNSVWKGSRLATPVGGGVQVRATQALEAENLLADEKGEVDAARKSVPISNLAADKWWWD
jgi:hypothetical protein